MKDPANDLVYDMLKAVSSRARHSGHARVDFKETLQPAWLVFLCHPDKTAPQMKTTRER